MEVEKFMYSYSLVTVTQTKGNSLLNDATYIELFLFHLFHTEIKNMPSNIEQLKSRVLYNYFVLKLVVMNIWVLYKTYWQYIYQIGNNTTSP